MDGKLMGKNMWAWLTKGAAHCHMEAVVTGILEEQGAIQSPSCKNRGGVSGCGQAQSPSALGIPEGQVGHSQLVTDSQEPGGTAFDSQHFSKQQNQEWIENLTRIPAMSFPEIEVYLWTCLCSIINFAAFPICAALMANWGIMFVQVYFPERAVF